jgi:hypothetical protein
MPRRQQSRLNDTVTAELIVDFHNSLPTPPSLFI